MRGVARGSELQQRLRRAARGIAPGLAAALSLAPAIAHALIEVEVLSTAIGASQFASVSVDCPPGTVAIGGGTQVSDNAGMDLTGNGPRFGDTVLLSMPDGPAGAPSGWLGSAENTSGSAGTLHVGVLCAPGVAVSSVIGSAPVGSGTFAGVTAECPEGSVAIGGGVALGNLGLRISETGPRMPQTGALAGASEGVHEAPDAWTAFARNPGGGSPTLKVAALCAEFTNVPVSTHVGARNTMANGGAAGGDVECPEGERAVGGGIASLNPLGLTVTSPSPWFPGDEQELVQQPDGTSPAPVGWNARGRNDSDAVLSVKRAAICLPEPGGAAAALAVLSTLIGVTGRRRKRAAPQAANGGRSMTARSRRSRGAAALCGTLLAALAAGAPASAQLAPGDLLVTDFNNARVWRVRPSGAVSAFSPRPGSGPNRLVHPAGIGVDPEGRVLVVDNDTGELVEIDAATGAQRALPIWRYEPYDGAYSPASLDGPYGLDVDARGIATVTTTGSPGLFQGNVLDDLAILENLQVTGLGPAGPYGVAAIGVGILDLIAVANGSAGWLLVDNLSGLEQTPHAPFTTGGVVWDAAVVFTGMPAMLFTEQVPGGGVFACDAAASGVQAFLPASPPQTLTVGDLLRCPFALAVTRDLADLFVADAAQTIGGDARVVHVSTEGSLPLPQTLVATLPEGSAPTLPAGIALVVPEPSAGAGALVALLALASGAARRRSR